jgi:hypothetical protein
LTGVDGSDLPLSIGLRFVEPDTKPDWTLSRLS